MHHVCNHVLYEHIYTRRTVAAQTELLKKKMLPSFVAFLLIAISSVFLPFNWSFVLLTRLNGLDFHLRFLVAMQSSTDLKLSMQSSTHFKLSMQSSTHFKLSMQSSTHFKLSMQSSTHFKLSMQSSTYLTLLM